MVAGIELYRGQGHRLVLSLIKSKVGYCCYQLPNLPKAETGAEHHYLIRPVSSWTLSTLICLAICPYWNQYTLVIHYTHLHMVCFLTYRVSASTTMWRLRECTFQHGIPIQYCTRPRGTFYAKRGIKMDTWPWDSLILSSCGPQTQQIWQNCSVTYKSSPSCKRAHWGHHLQGGCSQAKTAIHGRDLSSTSPHLRLNGVRGPNSQRMLLPEGNRVCRGTHLWLLAGHLCLWNRQRNMLPSWQGWSVLVSTRGEACSVIHTTEADTSFPGTCKNDSLGTFWSFFVQW